MRIISKISHVYHRHSISRGSQRHASATTVINKSTSEPTAILIAIYDWEINIETPITRSCQWNPGTGPTQNPNSQYYLSLLITPEDATSSNQRIKQQQPPTNNIPPATITENESLDAIFLFKLEKPLDMPLFSRAALEEKLIMAMYTDTKIDSHSIKLILNSSLADNIIIQQLIDQLGHQVDCAASARIITTDGATKTPIGEIDNFPIEVNSIVVLIKVLVIKATQYQVLVSND
ncbi:hypothetical protein G9A89_018677 [Geosiphon pyriformis]|nr:hypothetical protein G9A89_018677 [Geosiphon pyriformis]